LRTKRRIRVIGFEKKRAGLSNDKSALLYKKPNPIA
jgi:hypothetical protein